MKTLIAVRGDQKLYLDNGVAVIVDTDVDEEYYPPSIEAALKQGYWEAPSEITEKHLSGQHNQQSHARGKGSREAGGDIDAQIKEARAAVSARMREAKVSGD